MKTTFNANLKDNVAAATLLTATFLAIIGSIVTSSDASANKVVPQASAQAMEMQYMETIVVTAPRIEQVVRLETIVVTASRYVDDTRNIQLASK